MKTVFFKAGLILSLSILFSGCVKEEAPDGTGNQGQEVDILAEAPVWGVEGTAIQGLETKTIRAEDGSTYWSPGNPITVFQGTYARSDFYANIPEPATTAVFRGTIDVITGTNENSDGPIDFWAVYPASENNDFDGTGVTLVVKDDMTGTAGTFTNDDFPSIGTSPGLAIAFYNVCSGLALQVSEPGIMSVTVKGNNNENLAGKVYVKFADKRPQVDKVIEGKGSVLFNAPGDYGFQVGETYFIPILPVTFENGFEISYTKHVVTDTGDIDIMTGSYRYDETVTLERSVFGRAYNLDAEIEFVKSGEISGDPSSALMDVYESFARNIASGTGICSPMRTLFNFCGDDVYSGGAYWDDLPDYGQLNAFHYSPESSVVRDMFVRTYNAINDINGFLSQFKAGLPEGSGNDDMKRAVAEARVLRAYMHMMLAIAWGNPPLLEKPLNADPQSGLLIMESNGPGHEKLLEWCANECKESLPYLDVRAGTNDKEGACKVTKGFANAVAGKAYLFAGRYAEAVEQLGAVVNSGNYELVPGYRYMENFHIEGDGNEEKVFESDPMKFCTKGEHDLMFIMNYTTWMEANCWIWRSERFVADPVFSRIQGIQGWGGVGIPHKVTEEFIENDGEWSYRVRALMLPVEEVIFDTWYNNPAVDELTRDERMWSPLVGITNQGLYAQSFYLPYKIMPTTQDMTLGVQGRKNNYTIMRYAEVLLMYAEACIMTGDEATARAMINKIQERAGSKTLSETVTMDVLKKEKKIEMWMEGCRWPDMVRWGDFGDVINAGRNVPILYDVMTREPQTGDRNVTFEKNGRFYTVDTSDKIDLGGYDVGFKSGKHELFPYPKVVLDVNPKLKQNPGW